MNEWRLFRQVAASSPEGAAPKESSDSPGGFVVLQPHREHMAMMSASFCHRPTELL